MGGWLASLAEWARLPLRSGLAEIDLQIIKLRTLRDSYKVPQHDALQEKHPPETNKQSLLMESPASPA